MPTMTEPGHLDGPIQSADSRYNLERARERLRDEGYSVTIADEINSGACAWILGIEEGTLRNWRSRKFGPAWTTRRGRAWYALADVMNWIREEANEGEIVTRNDAS